MRNVKVKCENSVKMQCWLVVRPLNFMCGIRGNFAMPCCAVLLLPVFGNLLFVIAGELLEIVDV